MDNALVIIDMLNDFLLPSGKLFFEKGVTTIAPIRRLKAAFHAAGRPVIYSNDSHPADSREFADWTPHCLVGSDGARIIQDLSAEPGDILLYKNSLSLFDNGFAEPIFRGLGISHLYLVGVATEYSVQAGALDALARGLTVTVVSDAIAGVDLRPGDAQAALEAMRQAGARFESAEAVLAATG